ncbi:WAT1-related protein [Actinidia chinensis var. chinensis]|uniref:WAT1-related protein n=1 Tax=Actinidia chinensis var. chinensis TaxID=1590841 RepID=A0A2R6RNW3_ACTCC|nr:WAT1-related protein [Actinidia chinensis var. chinensis]
MKSSLGCVKGLVETNKPYVCMLLTQLIYAGMALMSKAALTKGMNPYVFVVYRQALATLVMAPFAIFLESKTAPPLTYKILFKIFMVSAVFTVSLDTYNLSLNYVTATLLVASSNTVPAMTFIFAVMFRTERLAIRKRYGQAKVLGSAVALLGALVYMYLKGPPIFSANSHHQISHSSSNTHFIKGSLIMLVCNMSFALFYVVQEPVVKEYPALLSLTTLQCLFTCIQSAIWAIAMERKLSPWKFGWGLNLISVAYCGVIVTGVTYWLRVWAIDKRGPVFVAAFTPMALLFTAIFSAIVWQETFYWGSACGAVLMVGGLYAVLWGKHKEVKLEEIDEETEQKQENTKVETA